MEPSYSDDASSRPLRHLHEPFYRDYLEDDLAETGFTVEAVEPHYVAKVFVARKPLEGACT